MRSECLITGCKLILENEGAACHGDLFILGHDVLIFNSVVDAEARAIRDHGIDMEYYGTFRAIMVSSDNCFERRGTFVFHRALAQVNEVAMTFMGTRLPRMMGWRC